MVSSSCAKKDRQRPEVSMANKGGYDAGFSRASHDLALQKKVFPPGRGYHPASEFSNGVAYLYAGYPQDDWSKGTILSAEYRADWLQGYTDACQTNGLSIKVASRKARRLGN